MAGLGDTGALDTAGRGVWDKALLAEEEPATGGRGCVGFVPGTAVLTGFAAAAGDDGFAAEAGTLFGRDVAVGLEADDAPAVFRGFGICPFFICARSILALTAAVELTGVDALRSRFCAKISALSNPSVLSLSCLPG